ncbi:hypothetical protein O181_053816 [Austropuccinia psidii MF-1]|uniref:Reverse transcriptase domain-containing protein n=1 Tax=Austropuccinia psidii MF-1 TaxID=1389203 RepID=A0A9Q3E881_9BASI|nr:hypothetical protein [Austropuccinia psidii MF-1]
MSELPERIPMIILDSSYPPSLFVTHHTKYMVELSSFPSFEWEFLVIDTPKGEDLILGFDFFNHFNPSVYWREGLITFNFDHKDCYDPSKTFGNDFSSAESCEALLSYSETASFPSSVHIPSLDSHQSILSSRDEVFKEIQDVGEDNSVSSLHLFFGNMDLPPSSYHDSLEELWDEEEVGVIYSLSNQESDTLRAYISEKVEKGFIQPSSSSTRAPVIFVKKNDGGLHFCVDYCKLNAVTRKNKYPVLPMNQLLTVLNDSSIFSKIYFCGSYNLLRIKEG